MKTHQEKTVIALSRKIMIILIAAMFALPVFSQDKIYAQEKIEKDELKNNEKNSQKSNKKLKEMISELRTMGGEIKLFDSDREFNINKDFDFNCFNKRFDGHWAGFEFGLNNFLNKDMQMQLPTAEDDINGAFMELNNDRSWGLAFNFGEINLPLFSKYVGIVTGVGFQWNIYRLKHNVDLYENENGVIDAYYIDKTERSYNRNVLQTCYFNVPFLLEFQAPIRSTRDRLFAAVGVVGGLKIGAKTKKYYEVNGDEKKHKARGDYQISPFRYGATARIGYRKVQLFADYSLVPLFEDKKGTELYPFTVGLRLDF